MYRKPIVSVGPTEEACRISWYLRCMCRLSHRYGPGYRSLDLLPTKRTSWYAFGMILSFYAYMDPELNLTLGDQRIHV